MIFEKIDIREIITDHFKTLLDENTGKGSVSDVLLFVLMPLIGSLLLVYFNFLLGENMINIIIASLSIFVGLLLNLLMLMIGMLDKCKETIKSIKAAKQGDPFFSYDLTLVEKREKLLKYTYQNISFAILISLLTIPVMILALLNNDLIKIASNFTGDVFLFIFLLTLLMILRRVHVLLRTEIS